MSEPDQTPQPFTMLGAPGVVCEGDVCEIPPMVDQGLTTPGR